VALVESTAFSGRVVPPMRRCWPIAAFNQSGRHRRLQAVAGAGEQLAGGDGATGRPTVHPIMPRPTTHN